jgi:hypothetical protein
MFINDILSAVSVMYQRQSCEKAETLKLHQVDAHLAFLVTVHIDHRLLAGVL